MAAPLCYSESKSVGSFTFLARFSFNSLWILSLNPLSILSQKLGLYATVSWLLVSESELEIQEGHFAFVTSDSEVQSQRESGKEPKNQLKSQAKSRKAGQSNEVTVCNSVPSGSWALLIEAPLKRIRSEPIHSQNRRGPLIGKAVFGVEYQNFKNLRKDFRKDFCKESLCNNLSAVVSLQDSVGTSRQVSFKKVFQRISFWSSESERSYVRNSLKSSSIFLSIHQHDALELAHRTDPADNYLSDTYRSRDY